MFNFNVYRTIIIAFLTLSVIFGATGAYKMWVYQAAPTDDYEEDDWYMDDEETEVKPQNAYVGGDAYNYIINATKATAYFVVSGFLALFAIGLEVIKQLRIRNGLLVINEKGTYTDLLKRRRDNNCLSPSDQENNNNSVDN
jgi:hypothetical protein